MTRVSENSSTNSINFSIGKAKAKLEDLQIKGSNLKRIQKPSDDPIGNTDLLAVRSRNMDANQYNRNGDFAKMYLSYTETALEDLTQILMKAKEITIAQSSTVFNPEVRGSVAKEIAQLRNQALGIANRRIGNKYLFAGHKTLTKPFTAEGQYRGDNGAINIEVAKDIFIPINIDGKSLFFSSKSSASKESPVLEGSVLEDLSNIEDDTSFEINNREPASADSQGQPTTVSLFSELESLENALLTDSPEAIQNLLESIDSTFDRIVTHRTKLGSLMNSVENALLNVENEKILNNEFKSKIEDADVAELFSDLNKQQAIINATYKSSSNLLNSSLLNFIR